MIHISDTDTCPLAINQYTTLGVKDLWESPAGVADFPATLPFSRFGVHQRPAPEPPPSDH